MTSITRRGLLASTAALATSHSASAQGEITLFDPPQGLAIIPSRHPGQLYGSTGPNSNWAVAQWDIPVDLPPFKDNRTANSYASVSFEGPGQYVLEQRSHGLECRGLYQSGLNLVREFDLFVQPTRRTIAGHERLLHRYSLKEMSSLNLAIDIEPLSFQILDTDCMTTQAVLMVAVVARNRKVKQSLSHQILFWGYRSRAGVQSDTEMRPAWFFSGFNKQLGTRGNYGFNDNLQTFGTAQPRFGSLSSYNLKLLPRLREIIAAGANRGLEQDLSGWFVHGTYHGSAAWGHLQLRARWRGFLLSAG